MQSNTTETLGQKLSTFIAQNRPLTENEKLEAKIENDREILDAAITELKGNIIGMLQGDIKPTDRDFKGNSVRIYSGREKQNPAITTPELNQIISNVDEMFNLQDHTKRQIEQFKKWLENNQIQLKSYFQYDDATNTWADIFMSTLEK